MKNIFKGFYNPTPESLDASWHDENTIFVFDTNVLLNLYGYAEQTRNDFFNVLKSLRKKIWLPYHVGLEYQQKRLEIIRNEKAIFNDIGTALNKIEMIFKSDFQKLALGKRFPKLHENTEKLNKEISKSINSYKKSVSYWDEKQPCARSHDSIRENINELFDSRIGDPPLNQEWLDTLYTEGKERYENKIPPGFEDSSKSKSDEPFFFYNNLKYERQFGDLIVWKQLIEKSKEEHAKNVIFVTDDNKEDWWYILRSRGEKQIGPLANLQSEIYKESNIDLFHMYNTSSFLQDGKKNIEVGIHDSSIEDANSQFWKSSSDNHHILDVELDQFEKMGLHWARSDSNHLANTKHKKLAALLRRSDTNENLNKLKTKYFINSAYQEYLDNSDNDSNLREEKIRKLITESISSKDIRKLTKEYILQKELLGFFENDAPEEEDK